MPDWTVVIPVKGTTSAKSRFGGAASDRAAIARAMALDTVEAVLATDRVARVIVVTGGSGTEFVALGAEVVPETGRGLLAAVSKGITAAGVGNTAVLLGDVPALQPTDLEAALAAAEAVPRAMVPDADGTGTVLIAATAGTLHHPAFGQGSRAAHREAGYVELDVPAESGLRRDMDTPEQLASMAPDALGPRTRVLVGG